MWGWEPNSDSSKSDPAVGFDISAAETTIHTFFVNLHFCAVSMLIRCFLMLSHSPAPYFLCKKWAVEIINVEQHKVSMFVFWTVMSRGLAATHSLRIATMQTTNTDNVTGVRTIS
jgi:hypothetical protein